MSVCAHGATVPGIDVSVYQGTIDWTRVKADGIQYAFIRVSNGTGTPDTRFDANWAGARAAGVRRGVYQYFRPSQDPVAQADLLLSRMGTLLPGDLPPVIDVEATDGASRVEMVAAVQKWLDRVEAGVGRKPIIYSGLYFWRDMVGGGAEFADYPLWIPQYGPTCPTLPPPWTDWVFFQYSSTGSVDGITGNVDMDTFNGDAAALDAFATPPAPPAPDAGPPPMPVPDAGMAMSPAEDPDELAGGCTTGRRGTVSGMLVIAALLGACVRPRRRSS